MTEHGMHVATLHGIIALCIPVWITCIVYLVRVFGDCQERERRRKLLKEIRKKEIQNG